MILYELTCEYLNDTVIDIDGDEATQLAPLGVFSTPELAQAFAQSYTDRIVRAYNDELVRESTGEALLFVILNWQETSSGIHSDKFEADDAMSFSIRKTELDPEPWGTDS